MRPQVITSPSGRCAIPLDQAWFCESCRAIGNDATCCNCDSPEHTQRLAPWLDREPINIPATGVFLTVIPAAKKSPAAENYVTPPQRASRAS